VSLSRRQFIAAAASAPILARTAGTASAETVAPFLPYTADSFYRNPIVGAPIDTVATPAFHTFMETHPDQRSVPHPLIRGVGGNKWGTVYAEGTATDQVWLLTGTVATKCAILRTQGFRAPSNFGARLTLTSDSPFCVVDRVNGYTVFGTQAKVVAPGVISVASAGITYHSSNGLDYRNPRTTDPRNFTSRGRISDAMVIRKDLMDAAVANNGDLGHVLHLFLVETKTTEKFCHPMVGAESGKYGFGAEGLRFGIRPDLNVEALALSPYGKVLARTLQRYGCYSGDNAGSASSLKAQQDSSAYPVWGSSLNKDALKGIKWSDWVVYPKGYQT
jgi:hypothetical protein